MSELRLETFRMNAADLGTANPLPALARLGDGNTTVKTDDTVPEEERRHMGYGANAPILPYRLQDDYNRTRKPRDFLAVVLENQTLKATFLPQLGGRLWSLYHKPSQRDLLYVNPVFQPANLAVRNAWFSGGVEWNASVVGHTPMTCDAIFAARTALDDGTPVLRLYEFDRIRGVVYQIDAYLPDVSPMLLVRVRLVNPNESQVPTYWWSNIAVPEAADVRVIVPAESAISSGFFLGCMSRVPVPQSDLGDVTYPARMPIANDFFFCIPPERRRFIAALDGRGWGLVQTSTDRLRGRKEFVWGGGPGGRRWQEFLSEPNRPYLEIQAGLERTQYGCLPFPAGARWEWLEAYGPMEADAKVVHGTDWAAAVGAVERRLETMVKRTWLEEELTRTVAMADRAPREIVQHGSGWGALEERRRARAGKGRLSPGMIFSDESLGPEQKPWLILLDAGVFPKASPNQDPGAWMIEPAWRQMLEKSVRGRTGDHWLGWLHLGVMQYMAGEFEAARKAWENSVHHEASGWAYRNLAVAAQQDGRTFEASGLYLKAIKLLPELTPLVIEACHALLAAELPEKVIELLRNTPPKVRAHPRLKLLGCRAALMLGDLATVEQVLTSRLEIVDMREGEVSLSDLWFGYQEKRLAKLEGIAVDDALRERVRRDFPPPAELDFRMNVKA